jgi:hypothetical protein
MTARASGTTGSTGTATVIVPALKSDGRTISTSITSGSTTLSGAFTSVDVGKTVLVYGAGATSDALAGFGPAKKDLQSTILSVNPGVSATLANAASSTASGTTFYGTDDAPALQAAINQCISNRGGQVLIVPPTAPPDFVGLGANTLTIIGSQITIGHGGASRYRWLGGKVSGSNGGGVSFPILCYLPAFGNLFSVYNAQNLVLEDLGFMFANNHFRDDLVRFSGHYWFFENGGWNPGGDNTACHVNRCQFIANGNIGWPHTPQTKTVSISSGSVNLVGSFTSSGDNTNPDPFQPGYMERTSWEEHTITIPGAGPSGADLVTQVAITPWDDTYDHVRIRTPASTTVSNVQAVIEGGSYLRHTNSIFCYVDGCTFGGSYSGSGIHLGPGYTNVITIERSWFNGARQHIRMGTDDSENVTIRENGFEPCWGGLPGAVRGGLGNSCYQFSFRDNWFGDFSVGGACHIEGVTIQSGEISGNLFNSPLNPAGVGYTTIVGGNGTTNEVQQFQVFGNAGHYTMTFGGQTTSAIAWNATAATIQTALQALSSIGSGNVTVADTGSYFRHHDFTVTFTGALAHTDVAQITTTTGTDMSGPGGHFNIAANMVDIHGNRIDRSTLFDLTPPSAYWTGAAAAAIEAHVHDNWLDVDQFTSNATSGISFTKYTAWKNRGASGNRPTALPQTGDWTRELNLIATTPYTLALTDGGLLLQVFGNQTVTVPPQTSVAFPVGTTIWIYQANSAGPVTVAAGSGVTLLTPNGRYPKTRDFFSTITLTNVGGTGNNSWLLDGDLSTTP